MLQPGNAADRGQDRALQAVVDGLTHGAPDRPDAPDAWVTAIRRLPARGAEYADFPGGLDARLREALRRRGIDQLYTHQAMAIEHALAGRHVVITTPTASGKTLCYNAPVLSTVLGDPSARALYLFPTKALAQDQLAELHGLSEQLLADAGAGVAVYTYDGDTPQDARRAIRGRAHVVLSNPDMLHSGILPHHPRWAKLLENLRYVIIDELHAYRGVFGSHLANVLRRLRRICAHYGSSPTFVCSSATIANPRDLAEALVEQPFEIVSESGAPRGEKFFIFVNPPVVNRQLGIRRSYLTETRAIASRFLDRGLQLIVFAQSRLTTEILTTYLKDDAGGSPASEQIRGYRGGYLPQRRREIEKGLREGTVRAVVSTNALELGIDIGALDACVMAGYPGTIAATWQRAGRAGRRASRSAAVLVASSAPLDQFVIRHPPYFFDASPERALINPDNLQVLVDHVRCAAFELPFSDSEAFGQPARPEDGASRAERASGVDVQEVLRTLEDGGFVCRSGGDAQGEGASWVWTSESYPADAVSLRSISSDNFVVIDTTQGADVIGETSFTSGPSTLHEKAIYLIEGSLYQVERLDFEGRKAYVRRIQCDYYTDAITYTKVSVLDTFETAPCVAAGDAAHGEVHVVSRVVGFKKIKFYTNENVGSGDLDLPEQQMHTTAYWLTIPGRAMTGLPFTADDRRDGVVGLAFALRQVAQLLLMCDRHDIGISIGSGEQSVPVEESMALTRGGHPVSLPDEPRVFVYDNYPGGIGFSAPLFGMHDELLARTSDLIARCECEHGCPACVGPVGDTGPLAKTVALRILDLLGAGAFSERRALARPDEADSEFSQRRASARPLESRTGNPESRTPNSESRVFGEASRVPIP
jgi:DEAD/DEAH box helicase domain-containing protein